MQRHDRIARALKLKDLHTFRAVVEQRSMTKAAAAVALTPAAVSKTVSEMEALLGVRLLERTPKGVVPTAYGEALVKGAGNLFDELGQTIRQLDSMADPMVGETHIGATEIMHGGVMTAVLDRLSQRHPGMVFHVSIANNPDELSRALRARTIDLSISRISHEPDDDLDKEVLFDDPLVVITGTDNPRGRGPRVTLAQMLEVIWCMPDEAHTIGVLIRQGFRTQGLTLPRVCITSPSMALQASMARTGRFFSVVAASYMRLASDTSGLRVVPVDLQINPPPVGIVTLKHRMISPVTQYFIDCVREVAREAGLPSSKHGAGVPGAARTQATRRRN
jgi:DNA-binding transcriptional LysR family regulator